MVGGFFITEAADKDEAMRVVSLYAAVTLGQSVRRGIEVHLIGFFEMAPGKYASSTAAEKLTAVVPLQCGKAVSSCKFAT